MSMVRHIQHRELGEYEGHPIETPLLDALDHVQEAIRFTYVGHNKEHIASEIWRLRATIDLLENDLAGRFFQ